ncbi:MAG TPA: hypothetical protein DEV93_18610 [Chloroflexi bacterium]|jgi:predicted transcriptional regulator|nr:hypothetical protein [Chloroflexota bacterium]
MSEMVRLSLQVHPHTKRDLERLAEIDAMSVSMLARWALREFLSARDMRDAAVLQATYDATYTSVRDAAEVDQEAPGALALA